jgi:putative ABC transport system permease protein
MVEGAETDPTQSTRRSQRTFLKVGAGSRVPFGNIGGYTEFFIEGEPDPVPADTPVASLNHITAGYASAIRLRLDRGRFLGAEDAVDGPKVAIINRTLAVRHFSKRDPIGQRLRLGRDSADLWTIVGIVADVKNDEMMDAAEAQGYVPFTKRPSRSMMTVIRVIDTGGDPLALVAAVRAAISALDPATTLRYE